MYVSSEQLIENQAKRGKMNEKDKVTRTNPPK